MAGGKTNVKARLPAKGYQGPDLNGGSVDAFGRVSLRSPHFEVMSLGSLRKWRIWILRLASVFGPKVFLRASVEWGPKGVRRRPKLHAPAYVLNDAPAAFRSALRRYLLNTLHHWPRRARSRMPRRSTGARISLSVEVVRRSAPSPVILLRYSRLW